MNMNSLKNVLLLLFPLVSIDETFGQSFGIIQVKEENESESSGEYCIAYNPDFEVLPKSVETAEWRSLEDHVPEQLCRDISPVPPWHDRAVAVLRGNCTFFKKAWRVQEYGGKVTLIISRGSLFSPLANQSEYNLVNITVASVAADDFEKIRGGKKQVRLISPVPEKWDLNLIIIWSLAVGAVAVGAFWSGRVKYKQLHKSNTYLHHSYVEEKTQRTEETVDISAKYIVIFVIMMCVMLLLLYFFYDYLVYAMIGLFCLASSIALCSCTMAFFSPCLPEHRVPRNRLTLCCGQPTYASCSIFIICIGISVYWAIIRHRSYAWILQDFLGFVFCVHTMKTVRLPNLKSCTILLLALFIYDVFFVFITPLFTKSGESIMVDVATGGQSRTGEMIPMVLKVPRLSETLPNVCQPPYSILGFGDILVPGLLVSYAYSFDLLSGAKNVYYVSTLTAYGIGMIITFVALMVTLMGQPALLYLVPCTLLTILLIGALRKELRLLWNGHMQEILHSSADPVKDESATEYDDSTENLANNLN